MRNYFGKISIKNLFVFICVYIWLISFNFLKAFVILSNLEFFFSFCSFEDAKGDVSVLHCQGWWLSGTNSTFAGALTIFTTILSDAYNNPINKDTNGGLVTFWTWDMSITATTTGNPVLVSELSNLQMDALGRIQIQFVMRTIGTFSFQIGKASVFIPGSPFSFTVLPGAQNKHFAFVCLLVI